MTDVVLVDAAGRELGVAGKAAVHQPPGQLHSAISVVIANGAGQFLIQQRAAGKPLFGSWWSNSCCTHPAPGETALQAAERRVAQELGMRVTSLDEAGTFVYRAVDSDSGLVELERDTVVVAESSDDPTPDPAEVLDWAWIDVPAGTASRRFTPWTTQVHSLAIAWRANGRVARHPGRD